MSPQSLFNFVIRHNAAFQLGLLCFLIKKHQQKEKKIFGNYNLCPFDMFTMDHTKSSVSKQKEESISI